MKKKQRKKQILEGYKKVGTRFIPPMMQIPKMRSTSYVDDMLPELIWIGLINDRFGYVRGARIIEVVFKAAEEIKTSGQVGNFALISSFAMLNTEQKNRLVELLEERGVLNNIRNAVAPLVLLYDGCPLKFLGSPTDEYTKEGLVDHIKVCVGRSIDKYDTPGIVLNGAMLLSRLATGTIRFAAHIELPNFNSVIDSPKSDEAKHAAGFMRSNALAEFSMYTIDPSWASHFWNRSYELSPCEFSMDGKSYVQ